jgi:hypothetical protein
MKLLGAKLRGILAKFSEALPPSFAKAYGGFSSPSSSQQAARYSAKENKSEFKAAAGRGASKADPDNLDCCESPRQAMTTQVT